MYMGIFVYLGVPNMARNRGNTAAKWLQAMQSPNTSQNYKDGVNATTVNPMQLAAAQLPRYLASVTDAVNSGRMAAALQNASVATWKQNAMTVGAQNLSSGAQKGSAKYQAFVSKFSPVWDQIHAQVSSMPKGGWANASARIQAAYVALKTAAGKNPG